MLGPGADVDDESDDTLLSTLLGATEDDETETEAETESDAETETDAEAETDAEDAEAEIAELAALDVGGVTVPLLEPLTV